MEKKYILTDETKVINSHILHRIKAIKDFRNVNKGDLGGWIEKEENLSHEGDCWVYKEACVYGEAQVCGKALIYGEAQVCGKALIYGKAQVCEKAQIYGEAQVCGEAWVYGEARVCEKAQIYGEARVCGAVQVRGKAKVFEKAWLYGKVKVYGKAQVCGIIDMSNKERISLNARIGSQKDVKMIGPIGSRGDYTTFARNKNDNILVFCGCFEGTIEEFKRRVKEEHEGTKYAIEYLDAIAYIKKTFSR